VTGSGASRSNNGIAAANPRTIAATIDMTAEPIPHCGVRRTSPRAVASATVAGHPGYEPGPSGRASTDASCGPSFTGGITSPWCGLPPTLPTLRPTRDRRTLREHHRQFCQSRRQNSVPRPVPTLLGADESGPNEDLQVVTDRRL
jgi:hypothetical protein